MWYTSTCDCEHGKTCKTNEQLDNKNFSCKKRLFDKLVLACEDEILNTTKISLVDKKQHMKRVIALVTILPW